MIKVGERAPEFELESYVSGQFKRIKLKDNKNKWTVLFFYPLDFTFVCPTEIKGFNTLHAEFDKHKAAVLGCSVDSVHSHKAWAERDFKDLKYPLLSDFNKEVSRRYNVLDEEKGVAMRGTFIIDPDGILRYMVISDLGVGRSVEETLRVLKALQTGELCPLDWKPGGKTLGKA